MKLFGDTIDREVGELHENGVQIRVLGDRARLSTSLQAKVAQAEALTAHNTSAILNVAINYGGQGRDRRSDPGPRRIRFRSQSARRGDAEPGASTPAACPTRTSSCARLASSGSATSSSGRLPTRSSTSRTPSGPTSASRRSTTRSTTSRAGSGSSARVPDSIERGPGRPQRRPARGHRGMNLALRVVSGVVLAGLIVAALWIGTARGRGWCWGSPRCSVRGSFASSCIRIGSSPPLWLILPLSVWLAIRFVFPAGDTATRLRVGARRWWSASSPGS